MSNLDSTQYANDKIQPQIGSDQGTNTPMVDMSNSAEVQSIFKSQGAQDSVVSPSGQVMFSNPYEGGASNWKESNWKDGDWGSQANGGDGGGRGANGPWGGGHDSHHWSQQDSASQSGDTAPAATGQSDSTATAGSASTAASGDSTATASTTNNIDQQLESQITQLQAQISQMTAEVSQYLGGGSSAQAAGGDGTALTNVLQNDMPSALTASGASTNAGSDSSSSTGTTSTTGSSGADNTQPTTNTSTTPSDPFLAQMQQSDPTMAQTLTDASSQLSSAGYGQLEQYLSSNYTNSGNDSQLMSQALTQAGLSSTDDAALTSVLQNDMPAALTSSTNNSTGDNTGNGTTSGNGTGTSTGDNTGNGTSATTGDGTTTTTPASGNYSVVNGQIIGPDGQPFDAKGVAVYAAQAQSEAATIMQDMPDLNFIRLASTPATDSPAEIQADIQAFQSINPNVVVEVEDHTSGGTDGTTNNTLSGQDLTNEENWYSQIASANVNNPNVWFGTANEPNDPSNEQDVVNQEQGIYNAIRGTGNNNMLMLEADGGGSFGPQQADTSAYNGMTNVAWDIHYYGWETSGDNNVGDNVTAIQNEMAGASGITESNGAGGQQNIPFIIGEYGDSTDGQNVDSNGTGAVDAVQTANNQGLVQGAVAWTWNGNNEPNNSDAITQDGTNNTMTPYGQEIVNYVNNGSTGAVD